MNPYRRPRGKRSNSDFNPDREFIRNAVDDFLKKGGRIEQVESVKIGTDYDVIDYRGVHEFLSARGNLIPRKSFFKC